MIPVSRRRFCRIVPEDARGNTAVEFCLLVPAFLIFIFGITDLGRLFWTQAALDRAVVKAARCAQVSPTICNVQTPSTIQIYAAGQGAGHAFGAQVFTVQYISPSVCVTASYGFGFLTPFVAQQVTIAAKSCRSTV